MKEWNQFGAIYKLSDISTRVSTLPVGVYNVDENMYDIFLNKLSDTFEFPYKVYGIESSLVDRVCKTWETSDKNLGILLNGLKGTGKTITAKLICNALKLPVLIIGRRYEHSIVDFLSGIEQDIIVLIDEYEKLYGEDNELLTIMDGVFNTVSRKLYILTTNRTYVNENLLQRPSRIRYFKTFGSLSPAIIEEIIDDMLIYTEFRSSLIETISNLEVITIDVVKALIEEVNIHGEAPSKFIDIFNVKKLSGKYNVYEQILSNDGAVIREIQLATNAKLYPREYDQDSVGYSFKINQTYIGEIVKIISYDRIMVSNTKVYDLTESAKSNTESGETDCNTQSDQLECATQRETFEYEDLSGFEAIPFIVEAEPVVGTVSKIEGKYQRVIITKVLRIEPCSTLNYAYSMCF